MSKSLIKYSGKLVVVVFLLSCCSSIAISKNATAMESCKSVEAVFVTGSGQTADVDSKEYISFARTMNEVADNANIKFTIYRLGKDYQLGEDNVRHRYPALPVGPSHLPRTFWADWNDGESGSYSWSVDEGVEELVA